MVVTANGTIETVSLSSFTLYVGEPGGSTNTNYGGGTLVVERLVPGGDEGTSGDWLTINDTTSGSEVQASYTSGVHALRFQFESVMTIRVRLSGATSPSLRVDVLQGKKTAGN